MGLAELALINPIVNHVDGVISKEGFLNLSLEPIGADDDVQALEVGEPPLLQTVHLSCLVKEPWDST